MLPTTSKTELNARCDRCRTMHTCPTLNNRMFYKRLPLAPRWRQNAVSRNNCWCCCLWDFKDKIQYVSDQLELNSKQHQAVKGRFVSYLQEHVVDGFNSSCYDIHWWKRTCWNICLCLVLLKHDKRSEGYGAQKSRMS